uniref:Uncharacterized protein n=1 Tax=Lepeophtheirus salmonis TaxID=72036 RepID=A0A0K2TS21_LEPSM
MARELGNIYSLQAAEFLFSNSNVTLGFYATNQEDVHINSIHLTGRDKCFSFAVKEQNDCTGDDYTKHISSTINEDYNFNKIRNAIKNSIKITITDRRPTNLATIPKLKSE